MKAWKNLTSFGVPVMALFGAMALQGISFSSGAAYAIVGGFMTVKLLLEHMFLEPAAAPYALVGREGEYRGYMALLLSGLAFGIVQMFVLITR